VEVGVGDLGALWEERRRIREEREEGEQRERWAS